MEINGPRKAGEMETQVEGNFPALFSYFSTTFPPKLALCRPLASGQ